MSALDTIDVFAGPGGWSEATRALGLREFGVELDPHACATRAAAGHLTARADAAQFPLNRAAGKVKGLIASPPCGTFSAAGKGEGVDDLPLLHEALDDLAAGNDTRDRLAAAWTRTQIGYASGLDHSYIANLLGERSEPAPAKLRVETAAAILALGSADRYRNLPDRTPVDPTGTRRRLQALAWNGHALERLLNGLHASNGLMSAARVTARNARLVTEAYDRLWNVPGGSATTARRARSRGWVGPGAWDDDTIDDPRTVPDLGASADPVAALVENAEWLHTEYRMPWDAIAAQLNVRKDTLHQYRTRERRRQEAGTS